jgi:hypothetical protein
VNLIRSLIFNSKTRYSLLIGENNGHRTGQRFDFDAFFSGCVISSVTRMLDCWEDARWCVVVPLCLPMMVLIS